MTETGAPGWQDARRILAVRLDNVGDVVMLGPALRALRGVRPDAHITLLASPAGSAVAPLLPWVDDVVAARVSWQDASRALAPDLARELSLVERLRAGRFDAAFVFTSFGQSVWPPAYAAYLAGIPFRAGQARDFGGNLLTHVVPAAPDAGHQVDRNLWLLEQLGVPLAGRHIELSIPPLARRAAAQLLEAAGVVPAAPYAVVAPGASCSARRYPPERMAEVVRQLRAAGVRTVVVGSEREAATVSAAAAAADVSLVGATTLPELAAVIARAQLVICNNSGPLHLADAFRRPVVCLYSGTELESQWRPRTAPSRLLAQRAPCSPCYAFECPFDLRCLDVAPSEVVAAGLSLLDETEEVRTLPCAGFAS